MGTEDIAPFIPLFESAAFVGGLLAIHALRRHADGVTAALGALAAVLLVAVCVVSVPTRTWIQMAESSAEPELYALGVY